MVERLLCKDKGAAVGAWAQSEQGGGNSAPDRGLTGRR